MEKIDIIGNVGSINPSINSGLIAIKIEIFQENPLESGNIIINLEIVALF